MRVEKRSYHRTTKEHIGDLVKGVAYTGLGIGLILGATKFNTIFEQDLNQNNYAQIEITTSEKPNLGKIDASDLEKGMATAFPYFIGGIGVLTTLAGASYLANKTLRSNSWERF